MSDGDAAEATIGLTLTNNRGAEVELLWVSDDNADEERSYLRVPAGDTRTQQTFPEHSWRCRCTASGELLWATKLGRIDLAVTVGGSSSAAETSDADTGATSEPAEPFYHHRRNQQTYL